MGNEGLLNVSWVRNNYFCLLKDMHSALQEKSTLKQV